MAAAGATKNSKAKPGCKYGSKCYRRNPQHLSNYGHPDDEEVKNADDDVVLPAKACSNDSTEGKAKQKRTIKDFFGSSDVKNKDDSESDSNQKPPSKKKRPSSQASELEEEETCKGEIDEAAEDLLPKQPSDSYDAAPPVYPDAVRDCIKETFLVDMPEDFYQFWEFCKACSKANPSSALNKALGLRLSGPFDILAGKHKKVVRNKHGRRPNLLLHQRYFYDPPEFQTVLVSDDESCFHIGYFRDDCDELPVFLANNSPGSSPREKITQCGSNIFAAVYIYAAQRSKTEKGDKKKSIDQLVEAIEKEAKRLDLPLTAVTKQMKERQKKVNCPTFHGAGMVVPVDDNDVGYRPVPETQKDLKAMLRKMVDGDTETQREEASEALQEIITFIQFANDECDYGEGLELGLCLFSYGRAELHTQISLLMPLAYQLLNRPQFGKIIEEHLNCRGKVGESVDELEV